VRDGKISKHNVYENSYAVAAAYHAKAGSSSSGLANPPTFPSHIQPGSGASAARLPYVEAEEAPPEVRSILSKMPVQLNIFKMTANASAAFPAIISLASSVLTRFELAPNLKELAILRTAQRSKATYEWVQHVPLAKQAGISDEQIDAINCNDVNASKFSDDERLVLQFTDELISDVRVSDSTFRAARERLTPQEIMELIVTSGTYMMMSRIMESTNIDIDAATDTSWAA
jgi:4-carboxymuconolactone decarboxylase